MKTLFKCIPFLALVTLVGCTTTTDPVTGKVTQSISPAVQAELQAAGNVLAQAVANAAVIGATNAASQYVSTGSVNTRQLASAEIYGIAANAQGYVGQLVPASTLVSAVGTPQIARAVSATLPAQVPVTQQAVDALQTQAANLSPNGSR